MKLKHIFFSKCLRKPTFFSSSIHRNTPSINPLRISSSISELLCSTSFTNPSSKTPAFFFTTTRTAHSLQVVNPTDSNESDFDESDEPMSEFLSRFTWVMRGKLSEAYPDCDKHTVDGMLVIIVEKVVDELERGNLAEMLRENADTPSQDFSQDLWKTVWEVSNSVLEDMKKERKKEQMKKYLQSENVKEMCRFASEVGIRGDMLREFRFKWAQEEMEMGELYRKVNQIRQEDKMLEREEEKGVENEGVEGEKVDGDGSNVIVMDGEGEGEGEGEEKLKVVSVPQRRGKFKYKIYGLDLSDPKWAEVADRIHEGEKLIVPEEPKQITGKCKLITEKILALNEKDNPLPLLREWVELLQPGRVDWLSLLDRVKEANVSVHFKMAELALSEESFQPNIRDYCKLIDAHAQENRIDDAERILKKMTEKGIQPDILTFTILVHMYSKAGNIDRAKEAFESLRSQGFQPDIRVYNSMITAYVNANQPKLGESLMREMEARDMKPSKEIHMALLRSFSKLGHVDGAQRISTMLQFSGFQPTLESCTLLVEAYAQAGDPDQARNNFDYMMKLGHKPDDRCTASMIAAYEKKNLLDKALNLLLELEKGGFEPGVQTYSVLVDWLGRLQLVDEAEELLGKIKEKGDTPPFKIHVSLCDMYARSRDEKKALQALGIVEGKKELLGKEEFERLISGLAEGGLIQDARRIQDMMQARGLTVSEHVKVALMASESIRRRPNLRK